MYRNRCHARNINLHDDDVLECKVKDKLLLLNVKFAIIILEYERIGDI